MTNTTWYPETQIQLDWQGSSFTTQGHSPSENWLAGWKFRRKITINNSLSYGLSDYQVWIPTTAFGSNWSLIRSSAQSTMADFRFTPSTSTNTFPYWIEDNTATPKGFWVKVSTLVAGANTIYMYYGNPSAGVGQSRDNTFMFFDDFSSGELGKWTRLYSNGTYSTSSGYLHLEVSGNANNIIESWRTNNAFPTNIIVEFDGRTNYQGTYNYNQYLVNFFNSTFPNNSIAGSVGHCVHSVQGNVWVIWGSSYKEAGPGSYYTESITTNQWYKMKYIVEPSRIRFYRNDALLINFSTNTITPTSYIAPVAYIRDSSWDDYSKSDYDNFCVRAYATTEPTISSVSSEEGVFFSSGNYKSNILDCGSKIVVSSVSWNPTSQPAGTSIAVGIRVSSFPFSVNSSTPPFISVSNGQTLNWAGRYIQYISTFTTNYSTSTPTLEDISVVYHVKPFMEKSITRSGVNSFGFGGGEYWEWQIPVKSGLPLTITAYIRYNTEYGGSATKPKLTLYGKGISPTSISATSAAENAWELLTINAGTPSENAMLRLRAEGFSTNPGAKFYIDDINVNQ